ncbi:MAG: hypothetical protein ABUT39_00905 [Acidobacteriota bacterium]
MIVTTGAIQAAPRAGGPKPASESGGVLERLWSWLSHLLPAGVAPAGVKSSWDSDGSHLDPNGNH